MKNVCFAQQLNVTIDRSFLLCFPFPVIRTLTVGVSQSITPTTVTPNFSFLSGLLMVLKTCLCFGIVKHISQKHLGFALNSF